MGCTRRHLLTGSGILLLSGCTLVENTTEHRTEIDLEFVNGSDESHTFHFAVEFTDGLGEWHTHQLDGGEREAVVIDPPENREIVSCHGVVDDEILTYEFSRFDPENMCVNVQFSAYIDGIDKPEILVEAENYC